jgi:pyruvate/2-oxoglutarate dehydrogenase complex dihydrolipoamide dehydrogenase (E3) component
VYELVVIGGGPAGLTAAITATAHLAVANVLDGAGRRVSDLVIPHCTYTDPGVGQVGITPAGAAERGSPSTFTGWNWRRSSGR